MQAKSDHESNDQFQQSSSSQFQRQEQEAMQNIDNSQFYQNVSHSQNQLSTLEPEAKKQQDKQQYETTQNYPIEKLYIMYTSYKKQLESICKKFKCGLFFGLNIIKIKGKQRDIVQECSDNIREMIYKIKYCELKKMKDKTQEYKAFKILFSPYYNDILNKSGIRLIGFNQKIYAFSQKYSQEELQIKQSNIVNQKWIFPVQFKSRKKTHSLNVYNEIILFLKKAFFYYKQKFDQLNLNVEVSYNGNTIYVIGENQKSCMFGKLNVKNILQGMICYTFKGNQLSQDQFKDLTKYLQKLSKYPIHLSKLSSKQYLVISKDTIIMQFINKDRFLKMIKMTYETDIGIFLLGCFHRTQKQQIITKICKDQGFHAFFYKYFLIFTNTFVDSQANQQQKMKSNAKILLKVAQKLNQNKQKYELISKNNQNKSKQLSYNANKNQNYFYTTGKDYHDQLSKRLSRDVMAQGIQMKKDFNVEYNLCEEKQIDDVCWYIDEKNKKVIEVKIQNTKKGTYFYGKKKNKGNGLQGLYKIEYQINIL